MNRWYRSAVYVWLSCILLGASGCGQLMQPDVETELTQLRGGEYEVDPRHTTVLFKVEHLGLTQYVGRFNKFDAQLSYDPEDPEQARLDAVVRTASVDVHDEEFESTLAGDSWFDAETHPEAVFRTHSVEVLGENQMLFKGELTLRGTTAPVALSVTFNGGAFNALTGRYTLGFSARGTIQRSNFGMDRFIPAVADAVELEVHAEFLRR